MDSSLWLFAELPGLLLTAFFKSKKIPIFVFFKIQTRS